MVTMKTLLFKHAGLYGIITALVLGLSGASNSYAQTEKSLGTFKDWAAYRYTEQPGELCTMWSKPRKSQGKYTRRGEVWAFVTHRPDNDVFDEIVFQMGYPVDGDQPMSLSIDKTTITSMYAEGEAIFLYPADSKRLIDAMKKGARMVLKAHSKRGTLTTDRFSLSGFTAAHRAISKACNR